MQQKRNRVRTHKTKESAIRAVNHVKSFHHKSFDPFRDDEDVVLAAVQQRKTNFEFASDRLKGSKDFVLKLIDLGIDCVRYASTEIRSDKEVASVVIKRFPSCFFSLSEALRDDPEIADIAIRKTHGIYYSGLSTRLQMDKNIALTALRAVLHFHNFEAWRKSLEFHSRDLEVMTELLWISSKFATEIAAPEILDNKEFATLAIRLNASSYANLSPRLREDPAIAFLAARQSGLFDAHDLPDSLKDDKVFVLSLLASKRCGIKCASERLRDDADVVHSALWVDPETTLLYASERFREDKQMVLQACRIDQRAFQNAGENLRKMVGDRNPIEALHELIAIEERCLDLTRRLDAQYGNSAQPRRSLKI